MMTKRQRIARLRVIRMLVEGPTEPEPTVLDTYQVSDDEVLDHAEDPQVGARWVARARLQIDPSPRLK